MNMHSCQPLQPIPRVGQNRIYTPCMTVYSIKSLPKITYTYTVLYIYVCMYGSGQPYNLHHVPWMNIAVKDHYFVGSCTIGLCGFAPGNLRLLSLPVIQFVCNDLLLTQRGSKPRRQWSHPARISRKNPFVPSTIHFYIVFNTALSTSNSVQHSALDCTTQHKQLHFSQLFTFHLVHRHQYWNGTWEEKEVEGDP
jgi:hypothetical protein